MRIARLTLKDIGPFEDAALEIPPPPEGQRGELVLFEGPNGSGKTTIAQAIACFVSLRNRNQSLPLQQYPRMLRDEPDKHGFALMPPIVELVERMRSEEAKAVGILVADPGGAEAQIKRKYIEWPGSPTDTVAYALVRECVFAANRGASRSHWAAFAYRGHLRTPIVTTKGPTEIETPPLRGALSFGSFEPASDHFGQLLINLDYDVAKALKDSAARTGTNERQLELSRIAASRQSMLDNIARALSEALSRTVRFDFPFGQHAPTILLDDEPIPLHLLGEGMRSTFAWLADLLVRLHRIPWANPEISPLEQDFWLILDEIDESLHPTMQMRILPALRRLFPNARMYVTTHSPFVVASVGEGYVFSIRPDAHRHVSGTITPRKLEPGQSLEWVVEEIFGAETGFIDAWTREALAAHRADIARLRRKEPFSDADWRAFFERRNKLLALNEQVQTVVAMQEVPVQRLIEPRLTQNGSAPGA